jgi:hypothetical protein
MMSVIEMYKKRGCKKVGLCGLIKHTIITLCNPIGILGGVSI